MNKSKQKLEGILAQYFSFSKYKDAIQGVREILNTNKLSLEEWNDIKDLISNKKFEEGEALHFLAIHANLPLDEDSDKEAYKWFNLFVKNVEGEEIKEY